MFKNIISPVQAWLLSQKRCVGCGTPLSQAVEYKKNKSAVSCKCGRIFIKEKENFRRAKLKEV